jgi:hypothetical protein
LIHGADLNVEKTIEFEGSFPKSIDSYNGKILTGMRNGCIYEIDEESGKKTLLMSGHHGGEAWGLEVDAEDNSIFTVGDDNKVM